MYVNDTSLILCRQEYLIKLNVLIAFYIKSGNGKGNTNKDYLGLVDAT